MGDDMMARHRIPKTATSTIICTVLSMIILLFQGGVAAADSPWPQPPPGQDPYAYGEYCHSDEVPDDFDKSSDDYWKATGDRSDSLYHVLLRLFNQDLYQKELEGVMGASVDRAWSITTGRPDILIAELDSGINWGESDLTRKCYLNKGELPPPQGAETWDANGDGVFNVDDYIDDARIVDAQLNNNGILDAEDLIWRFSDGEDDDGNGYVDDISGWDFLEDDNDAWDEVNYGHGTSECKWSGGEANNGSGFPGTCPNATIIPVRVGDSFIVDINDFAQGVIFGVDSGAHIIQEALGSVNHSPLGQEAIDYAYSRGVVVIASAADEESAHQNFPCTYERTVQVNSVRKFEEMLPLIASQFPPSYLYLGGLTNYGAHTIVSTPSGGHSSGATGRLAGIAALIYSAAENEVQRGEMWRYPGLNTPLSAGEVKQIIAMTADDIDFSPGSYGVNVGVLDAIFGTSQRFHSTEGWDPYFGYGRVNAYEAVKAVDEGRIPPEAEIASPRWFELINPGQADLEVKGRVAAVRADYYQYAVEFAPGWDPASDQWITAQEAAFQYDAVEGVLAVLDLGEVYRIIQETMEQRGGADDPNRYAFTVRLKVLDNHGNVGEDRKMAFCFDDGDAYPGTPVWLGAGMAASPRFADLDDDGCNELIVATEEGLVHAFESDLSEIEGWPVRMTPISLHLGSEGFESGQLPGEAYGSIVGAPSVGDLDHDGDLEVVAGDTEGRIYAWDNGGEILPGFPVRSNPLYSIPDRSDWWTEGELPGDWYASRFTPDRVHQLDRWNVLQNAFLRATVLTNLDNSVDGSLEIVAACLDQHVYAWHADGTPVRGWPVKLVDPEKVASFDPLTHTVDFQDAESVPRGSKIVTNPSVGDLDGDGWMEVVCGTNEAYTNEALNVSSDSFGLVSLLDILGPLLGDSMQPGNTRAYAVHHDGVAHGLEPEAEVPQYQVPAHAYLEGWPARIAMLAAGMLPNVAEGINGPAAIADVDGDGNMEVGISSAAGPAFLLEPDGTSHFGVGADGLPLSAECDQAGSSAGSADAPVVCALGGGSFATIGDGLVYIATTMGLGRAMDLFLPASQLRSDDQLSAWSTQDGSFLAAFPRKVNDMMFFVTPGAADIDADGEQEILAGSSYYDVHAMDVTGSEPDGWPKFSGGWSVATPSAADFDDDGDREVAVGTREGWLLIWETDSTPGDTAEWPEYGHDPWNTGCLESDARRPGKVTDLSAQLIEDTGELKGARLSWTAPGEDGKTGQALLYDLRFHTEPIGGDNWDDARQLSDIPLPAQAGTVEEVLLEGFPFNLPLEGLTYYFALQTRDDAGNLSAISNLASLTCKNEVEFEALHTWYLAEGSTGGDDRGSFETWVLVQNPGSDHAQVRITYMTPAGMVDGPQIELAPETRQTVNVAADVPDNWHVSTRVESSQPVIVERAMYWSDGEVYRRSAHDSIGVKATARTWYLAEGSTGGDDRGSFETWVLVQNPNSEPASVKLTYMTPDGMVDGPDVELAPQSRHSFNVADTVPATWHVSTRVESSKPVIAERAVYWSGGDVFRQSAHDSIGVTGPACVWYLAEGSTGNLEMGSFETWVLVQNPGAESAQVSMTYMTDEGPVDGPDLELQPGTRQTVCVADTVPATWHVSTRVDSSQPVIVERAMYWSGGDVFRQSAHDSIGVTDPACAWYLAEGSTHAIQTLQADGTVLEHGFATWILVQNPGSEPAHVSITYMTPDGPVDGPDMEMAPGTRWSFSVLETLYDAEQVSTRIESDKPLVAERAMYWRSADGVNAQSAHCSTGVTDTLLTGSDN